MPSGTAKFGSVCQPALSSSSTRMRSRPAPASRANSNGLLDRGRLIAHPWWTGELGRLGPGVHTGGHDRTIPDHAVFVQRSKSGAGLRHERNPAHSDLWNGTKVQPGEVGGRRPLCQMLSKVFVHLEHGHPVFAEHGPELVVRVDLALIARVLEVVLLDV